MIRPLWPNQLFAIEETIRLILLGTRSLCVSSPTGMGKSTIMAKLIEWAVSLGWNCAVFTNRKLLTNQLMNTLNGAGIHVGVRAATFESWTDLNAPVQICSMQTELHRVLKKREKAMKRLATEEEAHRDHQLFPAQIIFIDELHLNGGETMTAIVREYQEKWNAVVIGVTATPIGCSHICEDLLVAGNTSSGRECGALVLAESYEPAAFDIWKVRRTKTGVYSQTEMEDKVKAIWSQCVVGQIYDSWKTINPDGKASLGFAPGVKESLGLAMDFNRRGVNAAHIDSEGIYVDGQFYNTTEQTDRDDVFARSKSGEVPMIWSRFVLREGVDLPWVESLSLACPIASVLSFVQTVGRGLRASPSTGKTTCKIIDHSATIRMHGSPNADRDAEWLAYYWKPDDAITKDRLDKLRDPDSSEPEPITCPECGRIRKSGPKCIECGFQHTQSTRKVIQEDGTLKLTKGDIFKKRHTRIKPDTARLVESDYYAAKNGGKTFRQMRGWFCKKHGYWPPLDMPFFPLNKLDMARKVRDVPRENLHQKPGQK